MMPIAIVSFWPHVISLDRFCASRKGGTGGGGCTTLADSAWQPLQLLPAQKHGWVNAG